MSVRGVRLVVGDVTLRYALTYVLEQAGYGVRGSGELVVADQLGSAGEAVVHALVVEPLPAACQWALHALTSGRASSAICADNPEALPEVLDQVRAGMVAFPDRLVAEANQAPTLAPRLLATLQLLIVGYSNVAIGRQLHASESTVKRDIAALLRHFDVPNRNQLAAAARRTGFDHRAPASLVSA
jgi:DNA-binding CsgD family transcriptional regulator